MSQSTTVALYTPGEGFALEEVEIDDPRDNEVLVRIAAVGVCHTDIAATGRRPLDSAPVVFGHEGAGIVEAIGSSVTTVKPGDHVVLSFSSCGKCRFCRDGAPGYCEIFAPLNFTTARLDGSNALSKDGAKIGSHYFGQSSFGELAIAYETAVVKVSDDLPLELLGPLGCGFTTGAGAVMHCSKPKIGSSIAVLGAGGVGMSAIMMAKFLGCGTIAVVDLNQDRLDLASSLGATHTLNPKDGGDLFDIAARGFDHIIECTGNTKVAIDGIKHLAIGGEAILLGGPAPDAELTFLHRELFAGKKVRGSIEGDSVPQVFIPELIELYRQGSFPIDRLIEKFPAKEINTAIERSKDGSVIKPVLTWN